MFIRLATLKTHKRTFLRMFSHVHQQATLPCEVLATHATGWQTFTVCVIAFIMIIQPRIGFEPFAAFKTEVRVSRSVICCHVFFENLVVKVTKAADSTVVYFARHAIRVNICGVTCSNLWCCHATCDRFAIPTAIHSTRRICILDACWIWFLVCSNQVS